MKRETFLFRKRERKGKGGRREMGIIHCMLGCVKASSDCGMTILPDFSQSHSWWGGYVCFTLTFDRENGYGFPSTES